MESPQTETQWHYIKDDQQYGPISHAELIQLFRGGILGPLTYVWNPQFDDWKQAHDVPDLVADIESPDTGLPPWVRPNLPASGRPASITTFGVLNIVFGCLGLIASSCVFIDHFSHRGAASLDALVATFALVRQAFVMIASITMLATGLGLLNLKAWARKAAVILSVIQIVWTLISTALSVLLITTGRIRVPGFDGPELLAPLIIGVIVGLAIVLTYPVLVIIFLRKPAAIQACSK